MLLTMIAMTIQLAAQDGPVRTAPESPPQESATPRADPGPACTFGGRPVSSPGCPPTSGRLTYDVDLARRDPNIPAAPSDEACADPANRPSGRAGFDCALRAGRAQQVGERGGSLGFRDAPDGSDIPAWALDDPATWEVTQCGAAGDDACRRQARNRLAMARAGLATGPAAPDGRAAAPGNCRMVMRRAETGFGGSLSRVCGDGAEAEAALDRLQESLRPTVAPCDRPATLESQDAWIARCRALPPR